MATIESYELPRKDKDGKPLKPLTRYMVRYRTPQRTSTKKRGFKTKRDAQEFASTVEVEKMTGSYVAPSLGLIDYCRRAGPGVVVPQRIRRGPVELPDA